MNGLQKIIDWRKTFGLPNRETPTIPAQEEQFLALDLICEELNELEEAVGNESLPEIADAIADLYFVVTQAAMVHGLDPAYLIDRVYESNMSKLCRTREEAERSIEEYDGMAYYEQLRDGRFIIKRRADKKVLKGIGFKEPDWSGLK